MIDIGVQSAAKHNTGSDCYDCHKKKEFSAAGTVFKNYNGKGTKKNVKIKLVDQMGIVTDLGKSNKSGNIAVSQKIKKGKYLVQVGDHRSKSWHAFPRDKSCNTCHTIGGSGTVVLEERHTWLPLDNSCT
ncbi:MAG: hypothetical protein MI702_01630, partial [Chlorobiales bacterium]|nr:hypothetical protein [Chlorobiales bacterium]